MALTAKQEAFCRAIASGMTQIDAYRKAYPTSVKWKDNSISSNAAQAMADTKIAQRVAELRRPAIEKLQYGLIEAMREADEALEICREAKQGGAFVAAVQLRSKLNGLLVERKEVLHGNLDGLPHEDKQDALEAVRELIKTRNGQSAR